MENKELLFIHIPKTAGTTISELFKEHNINLGIFDNKTKCINKTCKSIYCSHWHIPSKYKKNINFDNYIPFAVIRDPFDRIISQYNYISNKESQKYGNINLFIIDSLKKKNRFAQDCHLIPQTEYIYDFYGNKLTNIIKFENLENDLNNFTQKHNINIEFDKKNNHKNIKKRNSSIDDLWYETLVLIENYYYKDFEEFGYKYKTK